MAKLFYQGHGSFRLTSEGGVVIYIDPFIGEGYDLAADAILVTHQHPDHNQIQLVTQKDDCVVISNVEALAGGKHNCFNVKGIEIEAVEAGYNAGHQPDNSVGFIVTVDGITIYFSGDTSTTPQMATFAERKLDYALLCADGNYNMGLEEASACAKLINAKHNAPVHLLPGELFSMDMAIQWDAPNKVIFEAGKEYRL